MPDVTTNHTVIRPDGSVGAVFPGGLDIPVSSLEAGDAYRKIRWLHANGGVAAEVYTDGDPADATDFSRLNNRVYPTPDGGFSQWRADVMHSDGTRRASIIAQWLPLLNRRSVEVWAGGLSRTVVDEQGSSDFAWRGDDNVQPFAYVQNNGAVWTAYTADPAYGTAGYIKRAGIVHLWGLVTMASGVYAYASGSSVIATLPAEYRPSKTLVYYAVHNDKAGGVTWVRVDVRLDGLIQIMAAGGGLTGSNNGQCSFMSLSHISFPAQS